MFMDVDLLCFGEEEDSGESVSGYSEMVVALLIMEMEFMVVRTEVLEAGKNNDGRVRERFLVSVLSPLLRCMELYSHENERKGRKKRLERHTRRT